VKILLSSWIPFIIAFDYYFIIQNSNTTQAVR
jgi:hypothetical protein